MRFGSKLVRSLRLVNLVYSVWPAVGCILWVLFCEQLLDFAEETSPGLYGSMFGVQVLQQSIPKLHTFPGQKSEVMLL